MGYTHYWKGYPGFGADSWGELARGVAEVYRLCAERGIALCYEYDEPKRMPYISLREINFNGPGEQGHETFCLDRDWDGSWNCCKTARKPYDIAVTAILAYLSAMYYDYDLSVTSDGGPEDWAAGVALANEAWPHVQIKVPPGV